MTSLSSLTWTRDSTLSSNMLETLATLPKLRRIEINGHSIGIFDPKLLWKLGQIKEISVVLPDRDVVMAIAGLAILLHESGGGLEGLEIIAQVRNATGNPIRRVPTDFSNNIGPLVHQRRVYDRPSALSGTPQDL
jgi:hypothetical protein